MRLEEGCSLAQIAKVLRLDLPTVSASLLRGMHRRLGRPLPSPSHGFDHRRHGEWEASNGGLVGRTLSHYRVLSEIGRGGMGVVYRAFDITLEREVALKVLPAGRATDSRWRRRLVEEARTTASLECSQICVVHEVDEAEGTLYIAMELVRGERLRDILRRARRADARAEASTLPPWRALQLATEIARGVACAHDVGIVHRDLKPSNIMVTTSGHAKLIDFGLAAPLQPPPPPDSEAETPSQVSGPKRVYGTPSYMSPEQICGLEVDQRSDIFTFGVLLHEMLTGANPFRRRSQTETLEAILSAQRPPLDPARVASAGCGLQYVLDRCLARSPQDRYQDMHEVLADLVRARAQAQAATSKPAAGQPAPELVLALLIGVAGLLVAFLAGG